jgi:hypothetical protein
MTPDEALTLKRVAAERALGELNCPADAVAVIAERIVPYLGVVDGVVVATGYVRAAGWEWVAVQGDTPRLAYDMTGGGRRDLPLPIVELVRELCRCERGGIRWKPAASPLY